DVRSKFSGELASGTTTDAVALACTGRGDAINYAGTGTNLGIITGKIVREAVKEAVQKQYLFYSNRPLINRLEERGITLEHMIDVIFKHHPELKCFSKEYVKKLIEDNLKKAEITLLTIAGLRLEEDYFKGLIPKIENINLELIDKIFGLRIAKIINNKHGVKEFLNLCKNDSKTLNLGMFSKSVIKGLLAGVSSKLKSCK
ncbi:MAG: adenosylcobinamide amidohydrolase, partial [Candidatus Bathyarchaeia archaeon]